MSNADQRKVLLAGATGLVGGMMLQTLLADPTVSEVHAISRRGLAISHPKLRVLLVDFKNLPMLPQADELYLALGTTIKVAGSQEAFRAVDLNANLAVAKAAFAAGARRIGVVSAAGANARSSVFYNRVKGQLESVLTAMELTALVIARPSLLLDQRDGLDQPPRLGEKLSIPIAKFLAPVIPGKYRPVHAQSVANALVRVVPRAQGVIVLESDVLAKAGGQR